MTAPSESDPLSLPTPSAPASSVAPGPPPGRARRAFARIAGALLASTTFLCALAGGVVLHLDSAPARRLVQAGTNEVLGSLFHGKIIVGAVDRVTIHGVEIGSAVAVDPRGATVIRISGLRARADVIGMARAVLFDDELTIAIPDVRIEHADVLVEAGEDGIPTLADTFLLREDEPSKPSVTEPPSSAGRVVRVSLPRILIGTAWVHGRAVPPRSLDADVSRLVGSVLVDPDQVAVDIERTGIVDRALLPARTAGTATYHLRVGDTARMWSTFAGQIGAVQVLARAELDDSFLVATADVPSASPSELEGMFPGLTLREPLSARVDVAGPLPRLDVTARVAPRDVNALDGAIEVSGGVDLASPLRADLDVTLLAVDPSAYAAGAPPAQIHAEGHVDLTLVGDVPDLVLDARTSPVIVGGELVPALEAHAAFVAGVLSGSVHADEAGMPTDVTFVVTPGDGVHFAAEAELPEIARVTRVKLPLRGSASVRARGVLRGSSLDADLVGLVSNLRADGDVTLKRGTVRGKVSGLVDDLRLQATLDGADLHAGGYDFADVKATASGPVATPRIDAQLDDESTGANVKARGQLDALSGALHHVAATLRRDDTELSGTIARIASTPRGVAIDGIALRGDALGGIDGGLRVEGDDVFGKLRGEGLDLAHVAKLMGIPYKVQGLANVDIDLARTTHGRKGHVRVELEGGRASFIRGISTHVDASFDDEAVTLDGFFRLVGGPESGLSTKDVKCEGTLAGVQLSKGKGALRGPLLRASTWLGATGSVDVAADDWNLACLHAIVPVGLPISEVRGTASTRFHVEREPGQRFPSIEDAVVRTHGLQIAGPFDIHADKPDWESRMVDARVTLGLDGQTGKTSGQLSLFDGGRLAEVSISADLDLATLADEPSKRLASLAGSALQGSIAIPQRPTRDFATLPTPILAVLPPVTGDIGIDGYVDGTLGEPFVALRVRGAGLAQADSFDALQASPWGLAVDLDALLTYDSQRATLDAHASKDGAEIATATAQVEIALADLTARAPGKAVPWKGAFHAALTGVPLGQVPLLAESDVRGTLDGTIDLTGLNERPELAIELSAPDLHVGTDLEFRRAEVSMRIARGGDDADTALVRASFESEDGGHLDATAYAGVGWVDGLIPAIDYARPADLYTVAQRFRITAFHPFVASILSRLDGRLDGPLRIGWSRLAQGEEANVEADMRVTGGTFHIPQIGQEFREATVHIVADPAQGTVRLDDITAKGISGSLHGWVLARLDGLRLLDAAGEIAIDRGQELPITFEGVPLGSARGAIALRAEKTGPHITLALATESLHLELPASSGRDVQPLDDHADIAISHPTGAPKEPRSPDALRYTISFDVKRAVVEGSDMQIVLAGVPDELPTVELAETTTLRGAIRIVSGDVGMFGRSKTFEIDQGFVRLRPEDPSNPHVNVTAHWDSPGGYRVFVDYGGVLKPITNDKIRLHSSPPLSSNEILALVLFGREPDEASADSAQSDAGGAEGLVSEELFASLLGGFTLFKGLSTRVGTVDGGSRLKTSLAYEVGDTITARATWEGGAGADAAAEATQTQSPTATGQRTEVGFDWRFHRNWLLRATFGVGESTPGQTGNETKSGLDLLWQYRY